jgi:hypothetical protein
MLEPPPKIDENIFPIPEALKNSWFNFQVNDLLAYHSIDDFRSEASKILFTKAWICTGKNDSLLALTDSLRKVHDLVARVDTRLGLVQQIVDCEQKSYQLMKDREKYLEQSRVKESAYWEKEGKNAAINHKLNIQERENKLNESKILAEKASTPPAPPIEATKDSLLTGEPKTEIPAATTATKSLPVENLVFKVQIGSFKNGVLTQTFKNSYAKISKLRKIDKYTDPKKYVIYTVGNFAHYADATKMKDQLILEGMKGSFVVAYHKNVKIPVTEAIKMSGGK